LGAKVRKKPPIFLIMPDCQSFEVEGDRLHECGELVLGDSFVTNSFILF
jgi:hypothetical protein